MRVPGLNDSPLAGRNRANGALPASKKPMTAEVNQGFVGDTAKLIVHRLIARQIRRDPCVYRKSNPRVVMVKSAQDGARTDHTGALYRARDWRILVQGPMCSDAVVIAGIGSQNSAQMRLAQDNDMVQALAPDRSDQPFGKAVLPR
jgi:hypothetical protein